MRIYPRRKKNGTRVWWASWTERSVTVRRSTRCSTKEAAERVAARWELERADPKLAAARQATLESESLIFIRECKAADLADATVGMYEQKIANLCDILGRDIPLADIDAPAVDRYFTRRDDEGASDSTQYKEWIALAGVLKSAKHRGRFPFDIGELKPPRLTPKYKPRETWLTWEQADALLAELAGDHRRAVAFVLATGARAGEWRRAEGVDVDAKAGTVTIRGTKTDEADATIPIPKPMRRWLKIAGAPPFAAWTNARRGLERACSRAKVPRVTWNDLRRTFTSLLHQAGVPDHLLFRLTRHASMTMIQRVYAKQTPETLGQLVGAALHNARSPSVNQRGNTRRHKRGRRGTRKH